MQMKTITLPALDLDGTLTPVLEDFTGKFLADYDPLNADKIVLVFENDADADAMNAKLPDQYRADTEHPLP